MKHDIEAGRWAWAFSLALISGGCAGDEPMQRSTPDASVGTTVDASTGSPVDASIEPPTGSPGDGSTGSPGDGPAGPTNDGPAGPTNDGPNGPRADVGDASVPCPPMKQLFERDVQPALDYCRSCHVPAGVADTALGRRFMLS